MDNKIWSQEQTGTSSAIDQALKERPQLRGRESGLHVEGPRLNPHHLQVGLGQNSKLKAELDDPV